MDTFDVDYSFTECSCSENRYAECHCSEWGYAECSCYEHC
jgi:hypothetical protein